MREVGALEAKDTLELLLDLVEHGDQVVITRHGRPVARLVREADFVDRNEAYAAVAAMKKLREGVTLGEGLSVRGLIEEGRR